MQVFSLKKKVNEFKREKLIKNSKNKNTKLSTIACPELSIMNDTKKGSAKLVEKSTIRIRAENCI